MKSEGPLAHKTVSPTSNGPWLLEDASTERDIVDGPALVLVPPRDNNSRTQPVLVLVHKLAKEVCSRVDIGLLAVLDGEHREMVGDNVGHCLRIGR